jgi:hypothetical protein
MVDESECRRERDEDGDDLERIHFLVLSAGGPPPESKDPGGVPVNRQTAKRTWNEKLRLACESTVHLRFTKILRLRWSTAFAQD